MAPFEPTEISRGQPVAWVTLGTVLYLESGLRSIWPQVLAASQALLQRPWAAGIKEVRRWDEPHWRGWDPRDVPGFLEELQKMGPTRPPWRVKVADQAKFSTVSIDWQDVPAAQGQYPRASWLRVRLPLGTSAEELFQTTMELVGLLPVQQGRAGYMCRE